MKIKLSAIDQVREKEKSRNKFGTLPG